MQLDQTTSADYLAEARRQIEICNACRYCEGYCAVFPAMTRQKCFSDGDLTQLANLCHNCRGCYHACQYTAPHEFALNVPAALAEVRQQSWESLAAPSWLARRFHESGGAVAAVLVVSLALMILLMQALKPATGEGFYAYLGHGAMVAIFTPAFVAPLVLVGVALRAYWRTVGGGRLGLNELRAAMAQAARLRNLDGGQGQGCNFEGADRPTNRRRYAHQAVLYGFLLCLAATSVATLMHYLLDWPAPYGLFTLPKLFGIPGGLLMVVGSVELMRLKLRAEPELGAKRVWGGEMAFTAMLGFVAASGLLLYAATGTGFVSSLLAVHLASVLALFLLLPYSKMVHGFFRLAALIVEVQRGQAQVRMDDVAERQ